MKLVDILARELGEWPDLAAIAVQDDCGEVKFSESTSVRGGHSGTWIRNGLLIFPDFRFTIASDRDHSIITRAQWQEARNALARSKHSNLDNPPVGATHYIEGAFVIGSWWMREPGDNWYLWAESARQWAHGTPSAELKNLMKPIHESLQKKEWDGEGLPPVGTICEWAGCTYAPEDPKEPDLHVGDKVKIIAHFKDGEFDLAAFTFNPGIHNSARGAAWVNQGSHGCFRPIRTPEQIAADEREVILEDMRNTMQQCSGKSWVEALYDAGYRKVKDGNQKA